ncbi:calreticulin-like [Dreissena polymorpha]|uniref:calreticulin-like n=1 Tax=Dreissena polymorpha TaxID=45954 RepID=UPI00226501E6|nr:calreticulin-like [Dreissena polymorpha]
MQAGFDLNTSTGTIPMQDYAQETLAGGDRRAGQKNSWMVCGLTTHGAGYCEIGLAVLYCLNEPSHLAVAVERIEEDNVDDAEKEEDEKEEKVEKEDNVEDKEENKEENEDEDKEEDEKEDEKEDDE